MVQDKNTYFMGYLFKLVAVAVFMLAAALVFSPGQAYAHGDEEHVETADSSQVSGFIPDEYRFIVASGDNHTLLVRRSAQLYDMANDSLELSEAQIIFVEHNVVRDMGARDLIYPEQMLDVMSELIARYAGSSQELGPQALAAWQVYADNADFDISDISPENVAISDDGRVVEAGDSAEDPAFTPGDSTSDAGENEDSNWSAWLAVAGAIAIVWYGVLRYRETRS